MNPLEKRLNDISDVISLYKSFDKYKEQTREELFNYLLQPFNLNQYKIFYKDNKISAFICWAFLDAEYEEHFKLTSQVNNWNCGDRVWLIDLVSSGDSRKMVKWTNQYFRKLLGKEKKVNYLRVDEKMQIYRVASSLTKECYN